LQFAGLVIAGVTQFTQRAVTAFEVSGSQIVKHQTAVGEMALSQFCSMCACCGSSQSMLGTVRFRRRNLTPAPRRDCGAACRSEARARSPVWRLVRECGDDHRDDQIALAARAGSRIASKCRLRKQPRTAATWPCGRERAMRKGLGQRQTGGGRRAGQSLAEGLGFSGRRDG